MILARSAAMLALVALSAGCARKPPAHPMAPALVGTWRDDDTGAVVQIAGRAPAVVSIVDDDGERFEVKEHGWAGDTYQFTYYVPSTDYTVYVVLDQFGPDALTGTWKNAYDAGDQSLTRLAD